MTQTLENLRPILQKLIAYRDAEDKGLTQLAMAEKLNTQGVESLTGATWSKYSIRRILKKLNLQTVNSANLKGTPELQPESSAGTGALGQEEPLRADAPLRQWSYFESIRDAIEELTSEPYTPKKLASELNKRGISTVDGTTPWTADSVNRVLKVLSPSTTQSQLNDDEIRANIRKGMFDTAEERFVAVPITTRPDNKKTKVKDKKGKSKDKKGKSKDKKKKKK
ncbi:MAG: hypothetical protein GY703_09835 [Gammaproteobacteria bacterium]|nr:hypothetical protein [Gammaproteobacteria bacterium]